jgi:hypothetical protein
MNAKQLNQKREKGQYFTVYNPFVFDCFKEWAREFNLKNKIILEPFAGSNNLIKMLQDINLCNSFQSYDIKPQSLEVLYKDTFLDFPKNFQVCITNPPYLARNSAKRRNLNFPKTKFNDLYKYSLDKCLQNCDYVGAIIPASFLNSKLFRDRLSHYILLNTKMFNDTEHPVCLALFKPKSNEVEIYEDNNFIGSLSELESYVPNTKNKNMIFNSKKGELGLFAIDNTIKASIYFCDGNKIPKERIRVSSRSITRIETGCENTAKLIKNLNEYLMDFRQKTSDIFLTPFKGLRADGKYRRRLDYAMARRIISEVM